MYIFAYRPYPGTQSYNYCNIQVLYEYSGKMGDYFSQTSIALSDVDTLNDNGLTVPTVIVV